jgi:cytochrome c-type biogenesis protein CcmH/NrfF
MELRSAYKDPSTQSPRRPRSGFRLAAQTPPRRLNLKLETRNSKLLRAAQLLLIAVLAIGFMGADADARFTKLGHQMMCMCGCNQVLLECNHVGCAYSERMRNELTAGLERGDSDSLVLQSFVQKYGNTVLSAPTSSGFNVIAWIMPFAVFAAASALTVWLVRLWKARPVAQPVARPNVGAGELDALRKKAREETEF